MEGQFVLSVAALEFVFRQLEVRQPFDEVGLEDLANAVERVARQPDSLARRETQRAGVVELRPKLGLGNLVGDPHRGGAVDDAEGDGRVAMLAPDHLQHEQLVEVCVEQGPQDRIEPERMVVRPGRDVGETHGTL